MALGKAYDVFFNTFKEECFPETGGGDVVCSARAISCIDSEGLVSSFEWFDASLYSLMNHSTFVNYKNACESAAGEMLQLNVQLLAGEETTKAYRDFTANFSDMNLCMTTLRDLSDQREFFKSQVLETLPDDTATAINSRNSRQWVTLPVCLSSANPHLWRIQKKFLKMPMLALMMESVRASTIQHRKASCPSTSSKDMKENSVRLIR